MRICAVLCCLTAFLNVSEPGKIGLLEPGYLADIIAVDEDPLLKTETLEHVGFVMKQGKIVSRCD